MGLAFPSTLVVRERPPPSKQSPGARHLSKLILLKCKVGVNRPAAAAGAKA
jgi:hypothetical protein